MLQSNVPGTLSPLLLSNLLRLLPRPPTMGVPHLSRPLNPPPQRHLLPLAAGVDQLHKSGLDLPPWKKSRTCSPNLTKTRSKTSARQTLEEAIIPTPSFTSTLLKKRKRQSSLSLTPKSNLVMTLTMIVRAVPGQEEADPLVMGVIPMGHAEDLILK